MIDTKALRSRILDLAIQGKLTEQLPSDGTAEELYQQIQAEKQALIKEGKIKKEKPLPEISADEIPFEIPNNWKWTRLGEICLQITDGTHRTPTYIEEGVPFLSVKNISSGFLDFSDIKHISVEEHSELIKRCKPEKDDILICRIGTLGKAIIIDTCEAFSIFVSLGLIKTGNRLLSEYVVDSVNSGFGKLWIQEHKAGGAMHADKINLTDLNNMLIPLPPLAEQKRIVERVEEIFRLLDTIDQAQEKYSADSQILKAKLITAGIQGKLTKQLPSDGTAEELYQQIQAEKQKLIKEGKIKKEKPLPEITADEIPFDIPDNWKWVMWGEITNVVSARRVHQSDWKKEGIPFYRAREIDRLAENGFVENELYISEELFEEFSKSGVPHTGDLMLSAVGTLGKAYIVKENDKFYYKDASVLCVENIGKIIPEFLIYVLKSDMMLKQIQSNSGGTTVDTLTMVRMIKYLCPLPPLAEQKRIADVLERALGEIDKG